MTFELVMLEDECGKLCPDESPTDTGDLVLVAGFAF